MITFKKGFFFFNKKRFFNVLIYEGLMVVKPGITIVGYNVILNMCIALALSNSDLNIRFIG